MCFDILMLFGVALIPYKYVIPNWDSISNFSPAFYQLSTALSLSRSLSLWYFDYFSTLHTLTKFCVKFIDIFVQWCACGK